MERYPQQGMQQQYLQQGMQPQMQEIQPQMQGMQPQMQGIQPQMQGIQPQMQGTQPQQYPQQGMQMQGVQKMGPGLAGMPQGDKMQMQQGPMGPPGPMPNMGPQGTMAPLKKPKRRVLTSLTLQIFIYFGAWWDVFYYILNLLVFFYKGLALPYPQRNFDMEFSFSWLWILVEIPRLILLSAGNKTEKSAPVIWSFIAGSPVVGMYVYFVAFQTYVLQIDQFLNGVALGFFGIQAILALIAVFRFMTASRFQQAQPAQQ